MIKKGGDKLVGTMSWPDQKDAMVKDLTLKDGNLTFSVERQVNDNKITIEYKLTLDGDKLKGKARPSSGARRVEYDVEGKREKTDK